MLENTKTPGILKKKIAAENALVINSAKWYLLFLSRRSSFYLFLERVTIKSIGYLWRDDFVMQRNDFAAERPELLSVFSFTM